MTSYNISGPEKFTCLRSKFIDFFWNKLPETFITWPFCRFLSFFFQVIFFISKCWCNKTFIFCMLEINNIMRFNFLFCQIISIWAMVDKFPKAFWFIFIDNWNTNSWWFFYLWSFLIIFEIFILFCWDNFFFLFFIQKCRIIYVWRKVNITVWAFMIKLKTVIVVNIIAFMLICSVWSNLEQNLRRKLSFKL